MPETSDVHTVADHIALWIEPEGRIIHIKTTEPHGDPVELNASEASELITPLKRLLEKIS
jgi:hypothetical protein